MVRTLKAGMPAVREVPPRAWIEKDEDGSVIIKIAPENADAWTLKDGTNDVIVRHLDDDSYPNRFDVWIRKFRLPDGNGIGSHTTMEIKPGERVEVGGDGKTQVYLERVADTAVMPSKASATGPATQPAALSASIEFSRDPAWLGDQMHCVIKSDAELPMTLQVSLFVVDERTGEISGGGDTVVASLPSVPLVLTDKVATTGERVITEYRLARRDDPVPALMSGTGDFLGSNAGVPEIVFNRS